jgi:predicted nucleic acid-binding protein
MRMRAAATKRPEQFRAAVDRVAGCIAFTEIKPSSVGLIYEGGAGTLRTLDAIHLATLAFFNRAPGGTILATYDRRLAAAAGALGIEVIAP